MITADPITIGSEHHLNVPATVRRSKHGGEPDIFTDIYQQDINIVTWQRELSDTLQGAVGDYLESNHTFQVVTTVSPQNAVSSVAESLGTVDQTELTENIAELVDMFCYLFGLSHAGLRLIALDRAMCPKFHVDRVPCRLVTTFHGPGTQWLPHRAVDRTKLGL